MLSLNEPIVHFARAISVHWYGYVLRREDGHVLWRGLDFKVEVQWKKGKPKRSWRKLVEEESVKVLFLQRGCPLPIKVNY